MTCTWSRCAGCTIRWMSTAGADASTAGWHAAAGAIGRCARCRRSRARRLSSRARRKRSAAGCTAAIELKAKFWHAPCGAGRALQCHLMALVRPPAGQVGAWAGTCAFAKAMDELREPALCCAVHASASVCTRSRPAAAHMCSKAASDFVLSASDTNKVQHQGGHLLLCTTQFGCSPGCQLCGSAAAKWQLRHVYEQRAPACSCSCMPARAQPGPGCCPMRCRGAESHEELAQGVGRGVGHVRGAHAAGGAGERVNTLFTGEPLGC